MNKGTTVGHFIVKEDKVFTKRYEFAAWYKDIKVSAGRYPVKMINPEEQWSHCAYSVKLPGVVTKSDFSPHFGGVRTGDSVDKHVGEEATYTIPWSPYNVAQKKYGIELLPEWEEVVEDLGTYPHNGTPWRRLLPSSTL